MADLAMITGASSGIGVAYAERLAADGWDLLVVARRRARLEELGERLGDAAGVSVGVIEADLSQPADLDRVCEELTHTPVDMLVNNAALAHYMPFAELAPERAAELVDLNVKAPVLLSRAALSGMTERRSGTIINIASLLAFSGRVDAPIFPKRTVYGASKSFIVTFSELLANEVAELGIRVQVVCPGVVRSEFHTRQGLDMSQVPRMEPEAVVQASLTDLAGGVLVSVPGLPEPEVLDRLDAVNQELTSVARTKDLPPRYAESAV
ncbi:MAG: SDR family NAD(P)-dependent oxidoreductase [Solirubrobacterales bacterium]|nr:SDR family NAD(P)-dependent oxidoreductase [Solirubrobacterales bacterium]